MGTKFPFEPDPKGHNLIAGFIFIILIPVLIAIYTSFFR